MEAHRVVGVPLTKDEPTGSTNDEETFKLWAHDGVRSSNQLLQQVRTHRMVEADAKEDEMTAPRANGAAKSENASFVERVIVLWGYCLYLRWFGCWRKIVSIRGSF